MPDIGRIKPTPAEYIGTLADDGRVVVDVIQKTPEEIQQQLDKLNADIIDRTAYLASIQTQIDGWTQERDRLQAILDSTGLVQSSQPEQETSENV